MEERASHSPCTSPQSRHQKSLRPDTSATIDSRRNREIVFPGIIDDPSAGGRFLSHLEANLSLLALNQPELASELRGTKCTNVKLSSAAYGLPTATYDRNGTPFALHSRYDPLKEARHTLKKQDCADADYFILLGFGLGYLFDALLEEHSDPSMHFFVIEPELEILRAAFEARNLEQILGRPGVHFAWPPSGPELAEQWRAFFDPVSARKSTYIMHSPSLSLNPAPFKAAVEMIQSQTYQIFTDINTLVGRSQEFLDNFVRNYRKAAQAPGVFSFAGRFSGVPAIIASAGPSLDKNVHELRGWDENVLILSTDTALKPLLAAGIDPHFVLTGDPSHANSLHMKGARSADALFVAEVTSHPGVFDEFAGRIVSCTFQDSSLHSLADLLADKGHLRAWGSVATMALDFALFLKCNPIIFVGQDLAHTGGRLYCSGVYFDDEWFAGATNPEEWQARLDVLRSARRTVGVQDIFGKEVESTDKLLAYWNWILKEIDRHPDVHFINATEGGILRGNLTISSLKEALYRHCRQNNQLRTAVRDAYSRASKRARPNSTTALQVFFEEVSEIEDILTQELWVSRSRSRSRLEAVKEAIYRRSQIAPLIDSLNQMGNVAFLRQRNRLSPQSQPDEIRKVYAEYFRSVQQAVRRIRKALEQLHKSSPAPPAELAIPATHPGR